MSLTDISGTEHDRGNARDIGQDPHVRAIGHAAEFGRGSRGGRRRFGQESHDRFVEVDRGGLEPATEPVDDGRMRSQPFIP
jgi:hypothetical protein